MARELLGTFMLMLAAALVLGCVPTDPASAWAWILAWAQWTVLIVLAIDVAMYFYYGAIARADSRNRGI